MFFSEMSFTKEKQFQDTIVSNCKLSNCLFDKSAFENSGFVNCKFFNCQWTGDSCYKENSMYITGCESNNDFENKLYEYETQLEIHIDVEELILRKFIKSASKVNSMKKLSALKNSLRTDNISLREIEKAINSLKRNSYIVINGDTCFIQHEGINYFNRTYNYEQ